MHEDEGTTITTYGFMLGTLVIAPMLAVWGASLSRRRGRSALHGAAWAAGAAWAGWVLGFAALFTLEPEYSRGGALAEHWAVLFLVPGLVAAGVGLWVAARGDVVVPATLLDRVAPPAATLVATALAVVLVVRQEARSVWPGRRELPPRAVVLEERAMVDEFLGDFSYSLRARMVEADYRAWMRRLDVEETEDPRRHGVDPDPVEARCWARGSYDDGIASFESGCM